MLRFKSSNIWEQQSDEKDVCMCIDSANLMAPSAGKAMAFTPALTANTSVSVLCFPFGLMQPNTNGVLGNISLAETNTLAISMGLGGIAASITVPRIGIRAMTITALGE
jgi:hypothetical protein